jgi:hypothetical protein
VAVVEIEKGPVALRFVLVDSEGPGCENAGHRGNPLNWRRR